jgi:hypothetical protein
MWRIEFIEIMLYFTQVNTHFLVRFPDYFTKYPLLQGAKPPEPPDQGFALDPTGAQPPDPRYRFALPRSPWTACRSRADTRGPGSLPPVVCRFWKLGGRNWSKLSDFVTFLCNQIEHFCSEVVKNRSRHHSITIMGHFGRTSNYLRVLAFLARSLPN